MNEPKYKIGDTVFYRNGKLGVKECRVYDVTKFENGHVVYQISWHPTGAASAHEREVFKSREEVESQADVREV